jgi:hypothetical protein
MRQFGTVVEIPKELQELVLAEANLERDGVDAFKAGDFARCISLMHRVVDREKKNWQARLYLAMSHYSTGDIAAGALHFRYLEQNCPLDDVRAKAKLALSAADSEFKARANKRPLW